MSNDEETTGADFSFAAAYEGKTTVELVTALRDTRIRKDAADKEAKAVGAEYDYLSKVLIPQRFADEGLKNLTVKGVGRVSLTADIYASVKAGMKEEFYAWLDDTGSGDLIQRQVPPSTLKAFIKGLIKGGNEYPEDLVNVTAYQRASLTKE